VNLSISALLRFNVLSRRQPESWGTSFQLPDRSWSAHKRGASWGAEKCLLAASNVLQDAVEIIHPATLLMSVRCLASLRHLILVPDMNPAFVHAVILQSPAVPDC